MYTDNIYSRIVWFIIIAASWPLHVSFELILCLMHVEFQMIYSALTLSDEIWFFFWADMEKTSLSDRDTVTIAILAWVR